MRGWSEPFADGTPPLADAWEVAHPGMPHPPTFCIYQKIAPDAPGYCCDFIFVSADLHGADPRRHRGYGDRRHPIISRHPDARLTKPCRPGVRCGVIAVAAGETRHSCARPVHRLAASTALTFTGERFTPEVRGAIWHEHWHRYAVVRAARRAGCACSMRRAARATAAYLLAQTAAHVIGVDHFRDGRRACARPLCARTISLRRRAP